MFLWLALNSCAFVLIRGPMVLISVHQRRKRSWLWPFYAMPSVILIIVIAASEILDGKGGVLHDTRIVIEGSKIVAIRSLS